MTRLYIPALTLVICLGAASRLVAVQPGGGCAGCDAAAGGYYDGGGYDSGSYYGGGYDGGNYGVPAPAGAYDMPPGYGYEDGGWEQPMELPSVTGGGILRGMGARLMGMHQARGAAPPPPGYGPAGYGHASPGDVSAQGGGGYQNFGGTCCGPHWYDFFAEAVVLRRENGFNQVLMTQGIRGLAPPSAIAALQTDDLDFGYKPGFRVGGRFQTSAVGSIEAIYLGGIHWDDQAFATSNNNDLYSAFSDFGNDPFGGYEDSDQAAFSSVIYDSELDSVEVNFRKDHTSHRYRLSSSFLIGVRYVRIDEELNHRIDVEPHFDPINMVPREAAFTQYDVLTKNDLIGGQIGSEVVMCLFPGLTLGAELKAGAYGNRAELHSNLSSTTIPGGSNENLDNTGFAFASDGKAFLLWQFHPLWKLRGGYEVLYLNGVATSSGNYKSSPFINTSPGGGTMPGQVTLNNGDDLVYHGFQLGLEFGW